MICMAGTILLMIYQEAKRWVKTDTLRLWGRIVGVGFLLVVMLYVFSVKQESTGGRRFILERTWELIKEHPITGYGWHGFEREYMPQQAEYFKAHPDSPAAWYADEISHPLNEYLYLWVDFGIIAPLLLLFVFAVPYYVYHRTKDHLLGQPLMAVMVVLLFSLTSYPHRDIRFYLAVLAVHGIEEFSSHVFALHVPNREQDQFTDTQRIVGLVLEIGDIVRIGVCVDDQ